ncbi:tetratricopeptide repeat protein [Cyanobium sp. N.Huapi 1H5]|uniref:O-linked N-acetylglucosamine transferase, SPINDLY family protein n=1 Tax=Cyanobium sp. N.Huapi 1H5 TaxID=2823719 RepID=UPI0020CDFA5D|nr:tetratricopeptide repeat protein [Cyanobium sp. N.Huapi 1H5]MCP9837859.1 tetratricopeptide repeat protein [Cyanobium sp. N.Huapi 1H5]
MKDFTGREGPVEHLGDLPSLRESLQAIDDSTDSGTGQVGAAQLSELFLSNCATTDDWILLMKIVIKHRLVALLEPALMAVTRFESVTPSFWEDCAKALSEVSDVCAAEAAFRRAIHAHPAEAGLLDAFGLFLSQKGKPAEAADLYTAFLKSPGCLVDPIILQRIFLHLAQALLRVGSNESALEVLLQLSLLCPEHREVDVLMATALKNLREFDQAITYFQRALAHHDCPVDIMLDIGDCYNQLNRPDLAAERYEVALSGDLNDREREILLMSLAQMYFRVGEHDRSIELYREILKSDPKHVLAHYFLLISLSVVGRPQVGSMTSVAQSLWRNYRSSEEPPTPSPHDQASKAPPFSNTTEDSRIRIGILSAEIGEHVVGFFLAPFLENYDRERYQIDILSVRNYNDQRSLYLKDLADTAIDLAGLNQMQARELIQSRSYDIVVDTSGYLHSAGLFILSTRCAPIQCHYIGCHATTGLDTIDYFIGDHETVPSEFATDYSEKLWRLPRPWLARSYSDGVPIAVSRASHDRPVFGCFSSLHKINKKTLQFWGAALQCVQGSLLIVKDRLSGVPSIQTLILEELMSFGVDSCRVTFLGQTLGWREHMDHFNLIDIAFDTTPWSGATTAFDTLSMGVPLIGIRGDCTSARMSSSVLKAIGADDWISETPEEFASIALGLASDLNALRGGKEKLQHRVLKSSLYDAVGLTRALEYAFEEMFRKQKKRQGLTLPHDS